MLRSGSVYPPGTRIADRYEVAGRPLMGGMGIVYLCFDHWERRPVALKTFLPELLSNRSARDRFLREGTTWVNLGSHAHIVRAYAVKRIGDGREVYLVLELVAKEQGRADASLRSWLVPGRPLPIEQTLLFGLQIARGMAYATATIPGLVHRDLKPENVLVGRDRLPGMGVNRLRVTDFGLAALLQDSGVPAPEALEITGASRLRRTQLTRGVVGTPLYMAPEQWQGKGVCVQTDMYAFGCILHEMLAGHLAVEGNNTAELERAHCGGRVQPLPIGLPAVVKRIVDRCLAREPGARYGSWEAVEEALEAAYAEVTRRAAPGPEPAQSLDRAERVAVGWSYTAMGLSYQDIGKLKVALAYSQRALEVGQAEAEHRLEIAGLKNMANAYSDLGDGRRAVRHCERALAIARKIGDRAEEGRALRNLGLICENPANMAWVRGYDVSRARGFFKRYLEIAREIGDRAEEGKALVSLGEFYALMWWPPRAIKLCKQALAIARELATVTWRDRL